MTVCLADNFEGVELMLRIVLGQKDIKVKSVRTQEIMKNLQGRSAILDVHAVDSTGKEFDVEVQRSDAGAGAKRARHNSSLMDAHILKPGADTEDIPDSYGHLHYRKRRDEWRSGSLSCREICEDWQEKSIVW